MPTLLLTPRQTEDSQALWRAACGLGWSTERIQGWRVPQHFKSLSDPVLYVEALFGPSLAEQLGRTLLDPPEDWLARLPFEHRRRDVALTTFGEARGNPGPRFVKPPNDKSFPASVYRGEELPAEFPDDMPVLVSEVVRWETEFRCFVLDREVRTASISHRDGELQREAGFACSQEEREGLMAFMAALLADPRVELPRATVVDAGVIAGRGWACVEQNAAWSAGIYGCDPTAVLEVIRHASVAAHPAPGP